MEHNNFQSSTFNSQLILVAIVDDHKVVAEGFEHLINESGMAQAIGKAHSVTGCWRMLADKTVDALLHIEIRPSAESFFRKYSPLILAAMIQTNSIFIQFFNLIPEYLLHDK
ncbi:MAG: hypothetical protein LBG96_02850 [Tannerella sp.]|jgi:hypothetical protein|nr:hypothetical protein [Tannerella sp.]